jgi:hypothetical protein
MDQQPPSPMEQALSGKLISEINNGLQCVAANISFQQQVAALQAALTKAQDRIKELEAKYEPKSEPEKPQ